MTFLPYFHISLMQILKKHRRPSVIKKAVPFNFLAPQLQLVAQTEETTRASLEGSAQVCMA